jgi:predicted transposase/invertase (TIGR01784 family)
VDEDLKRHASDLLYNVKLKSGGDARIVVLVDHKSGPEKWVALQLLRYQVQIWQEEKNDKADKLPVVIPVVLYHGRKKWRVSEHFSDLFPPVELSLAWDFIPHFRSDIIFAI